MPKHFVSLFRYNIRIQDSFSKQFWNIDIAYFHPLPTWFVKVGRVSVPIEGYVSVCSVSPGQIRSKTPHFSKCRLPVEQVRQKHMWKRSK